MGGFDCEPMFMKFVLEVAIKNVEKKIEMKRIDCNYQKAESKNRSIDLSINTCSDTNCWFQICKIHAILDCVSYVRV